MSCACIKCCQCENGSCMKCEDCFKDFCREHMNHKCPEAERFGDVDHVDGRTDFEDEL